MKAQHSGFTLVELLISFVIVVVLLGLITEIFRSSRTTYATQTEIADRQQAQLISVGQLSYEVALAGYRGTDSSAMGRTFTSPTFDVTSGTNSDSLTVRYYEDRWTQNNQVVLKQIKFSVVGGALIRTDLTDPTNPLELVNGVDSLHVISYLNRDGDSFPTEPNNKDDVSGMVLQLTFNNNTPNDTTDDTTQDLSIGLDNKQQEGTTIVVQN